MNTIISAVVGAIAAAAVTIGGINVATDAPKPVAQTDLYRYSSR